MAAGFKLIEDYFTLTPEALGGDVVVPPSAYEGKMTGGWSDPSSDNWNCVASQFEGINHLRRTPASRPLYMLGEYLHFELLSGKGAGLGQREFGGEYTQHQWAPLWVLWCLWPGLALRAPESFTPEREADLERWLLAWLGWLGAAGVNRPGRVLVGAEETTPGPRVIRGAGRKTPLNFTTLNGERGFVYYNGRQIYLVEKGQNDIFDHFCLGNSQAIYRRIEQALAQRKSARGLVSESNRDTFRLAAAGDPDALDRCAALMRGFKSPRCRPWIRVYADGTKAMGILKAASQSTAPVYATIINADGIVECLVIDRGDRSEADPGAAVIDDAAGTVTARRNNGTGQPVTLRLPPESECTWKLDTLEDGSIVTRRRDGSAPAPPPAPVPAPSPEPGPAPAPGSIDTGPFVGFGADPGHGTLATAGNLGSFNCARPTNVRGLAVWEKGHGGLCWGRELKSRDEAAGWHRLLREVRVGEGYREFCRSRSELGNHFLPLALPADGTPLDWTDRFWIVRERWLDPEIGADGRPTGRTVEHTDEIGPYESECSARYLGEVDVPNAWRARAIARTDFMARRAGAAAGSRSLADYQLVEEYHFAEHLGLIRWQRWQDGRLTDDVRVAGVHPVAKPSKFRGVTPDGRDGDLCHLGFAPAPPPPTSPIRWPARAPAGPAAAPTLRRRTGGSASPPAASPPSPQPTDGQRRTWLQRLLDAIGV